LHLRYNAFMRLFIAILIGKIIAFVTQTFHIGGGSAAPGLYALMIEPDLIEKTSSRIRRNVIITGTNGKTTTARILAHLANEAGLKIINNHTGSNLERGIASALINFFSSGVNLTHTRGVVGRHLGIWELDEAAFNAVAPKLKPDVIVFLNVFRDQMDRYGEIDSVVNHWCETLKKLSTNTIVLINGDDVNTVKLKNCFKGKIETFGVENYKILGESLKHIKHLHKLDFEAKKIKTNGLSGSSFQFSILNSQFSINLPVPGIYHIYDAVAALGAAYHLNLPLAKLLKSLKNFSPAFGRVEKLPFGYIFLIKNPTGATQVFETIAPQIKPEDRLLIALNDNLADGTDVSWIWDADFSSLRAPTQSGRGNLIICSGSRAYDLAVRLKYAGFGPKQIHVEPNLKIALKEARKGLNGTLFILPTYTVLLELQEILSGLNLKKPYWQQD